MVEVKWVEDQCILPVTTVPFFYFLFFKKGSLALLKIITGYLNIVHKNIVILKNKMY